LSRLNIKLIKNVTVRIKLFDHAIFQSNQLTFWIKISLFRAKMAGNYI